MHARSRLEAGGQGRLYRYKPGASIRGFTVYQEENDVFIFALSTVSLLLFDTVG